MNCHNITTDDMLNGDGLRTVLWVSGCEHQCNKCQNPETWDVNSGIKFGDIAEAELFDNLSKPHISGLTVSGGDPVHPQNKDCVSAILRKAKELFPRKRTWLYTGYEYNEIKNEKMLDFVDVIVDGRYVDQLKDGSLYWRGSSNQRVIDARESASKDTIVLYKGGSHNVL